MDHQLKFPDNFLWGAATSAYQVEGNNSGADWWQWEIDNGKEKSGAACRHYELYKEDFDLAKSLNHNAHRFSIEWSRIEPEEGVFQEAELRHYIDVVDSLRLRGIEPIVTLHHFTNPRWFSRQGGWLNKKAPEYFTRYCGHVVTALSERVRYWITINEPTVLTAYGYLSGVWPPGLKSPEKGMAVLKTLAAAHVKAYNLIHNIYNKKSAAGPFVGFAQFTQAFVPCADTLMNKTAVYLRNKTYNLGFIDCAARRKSLDFIGINYYYRHLVHSKKFVFDLLSLEQCRDGCKPLQKTSLGWDIYPEGIYDILSGIKKYNLPVIITENGIAASDDNMRWAYIRDHLLNIGRAMDHGVDVRGYLYWSLLDNFEWDKGFTPRFGLVDVDYKTCRRSVRASAVKLSEIRRINKAPLDIP